MTVTYSLNVANTRLCGFAKLLFRWKGSIYKLMYRELLIFMILYYSLSFLYRYGLDEKNKLIFAEISDYCQSFTKFIPLSFVLGFYVTIVVGRWWEVFMKIPWPDKCMMIVSSHLHGTDDRSRMMRRTIARYLVLLLALTFQACSSSVKKRFPTVDHLQEAGLMTNAERIAYEKVPETHGRWWIPAQWCACILVRARKEKRIKHDILLRQVLDELFEYRSGCGMIFCYDWISIPLVYTQTVTIATYVYFIASIMARQYIDTTTSLTHSIDSYVPIFTILEFLCYMGWLKVAEQLINPFGEDDDDFELNWMLDRNLFIGLYLADEMHNQFPILVKDSFWNEEEPILPYTKSSLNLRSKAHLGSAVNIFVGEEESEFLPLETVMEEEKDDYVLNDMTDNITPDVGNYRFNYKMGKNADLDGVSVSTTGLRIPDSIPGHKFFNILLGQSSENVNKNTADRYTYYNSKKDLPDRRSVPPSSQASTFLQTPIRFLSFNNKNKKLNVTRSNTTSTNNSTTKLARIKQRKRSSGTNSLGLKNADSSTAISRISNEDLNSLQSEALSFNYKSTPIALRKYSFRGQTPADDQQSLINFEKFPELAQLNQLNSISSSVDSNTNQPMLAYLQGNNQMNPNNSRFSVYKSQQPSPQPHQLMSQLNQKLAQLEKNNQYNQYYQHYGQANYPHYSPNYQANQPDDALSTVSTISGLQMNPILPFNPVVETATSGHVNKQAVNLLERSNSRKNETKVTIEDDKPPLSPTVPNQPTAIFNINNTTNSTLFTKPPIAPETNTLLIKEKDSQSVPITTPLSIKIDETNELDKANEGPKLIENLKDNKELVTIVEEKIENTSQTDNESLESDQNKESEKAKKEVGQKIGKKLGKKLSVDSIYEPTSSQESLSPFQSNQNTVTSFADFMESMHSRSTRDEGKPNKND